MASTRDLEFELLKLTLSLYNNPLIPRIIVQYFIDTLIAFIYNLFLPILIDHLRLLNVDEKLVTDLNKIVNLTKEIFEKFKNEHQRFLVYKEKGLMIDPQGYEIDGKNVSGMYP